MAVAFIQEIKFESGDRSTTHYDAISARIDLAGDWPKGLVIHTVGFDDVNSVFRIYDVWESREDGERFFTERLMPAVQEEMGAMGADMAGPERESWYELHDLARL